MSDKTYKIENFEDHSLLVLNAHLNHKDCKIFESEIELITANTHTLLVIDCGQLSALPKDWVRNFLKLHVNIKSRGKTLKIINTNNQFLSFLRDEGLEDTFTRANNLQEALGLKPQVKRTLDTEFVNPFLTATMHVLKVQAGVEVTAGQIYKKKSDEKISGDISGIIGIVSDAFRGSVIISFPENTFLKIMSSMLGEEFQTVTQDIVDGAGELTNIIFGQAKVVLNEKGYGIKTAIPSVIRGKEHATKTLTKGPVVVVPFTSPAGEFVVEICLSN